jgi:hypothetical protein
MFSHTDAFLAEGLFGGPMSIVADVARQAASVAVRILSGESLGASKTPPIDSASQNTTGESLQRWKISESRLPRSDIYFRSPSPWDQYRWQINAGVAALLLQAAIITRLVIEHRGRHLAEAEANGRGREVVHLNRYLLVAMGPDRRHPLKAGAFRAPASRLIGLDRMSRARQGLAKRVRLGVARFAARHCQPRRWGNPPHASNSTLQVDDWNF